MLKILKELEKLDSIQEKISFLEASLKLTTDEKVEDQLTLILDDLKEELENEVSSEDSIDFIELKSNTPKIDLSGENLEQIAEELKNETVETLDEVSLDKENINDYSNTSAYSATKEFVEYSSTNQDTIGNKLSTISSNSEQIDESLQNSLPSDFNKSNSDSQMKKNYSDNPNLGFELQIGRERTEILNLDETEIIKKSQKDKTRKGEEYIKRKR